MAEAPSKRAKVSSMVNVQKGRFEGKVGIVTGGSAGIGKACALALVKEGCKVAITTLEKDKIGEEGLKVEFGEHHASVIEFAGDMSEDTFCVSVVEGTIAKWGSIHHLVSAIHMHQ